MASNLFDLSGKTALVTGGARGIGLGLATGLAESGADVALVATHDVAFLDQEDFEVHQRLIGIQQTVHHRDISGVPNDQFYLKTKKPPGKSESYLLIGRF